MAVWRQACVSASLGLGSPAAAWARQPLAAGRGTGMREVPQRVPWPCPSPAPRFLLLVSALDQLQRTGRSRREARVEGSGPARRPPPGRASGTSGPFSPPSVGTRSPPRGRACTPVSAGSSCPTVGSAGEGVGLGRDRLCWLEAAVPQEDSGLPCHRRGEERRKGVMVPEAGRPAAPHKARVGRAQRKAESVPRGSGPVRASRDPGAPVGRGSARACLLHGAAVPRAALLPGQQTAWHLSACGLRATCPAGLFPGTGRSGRSAASACFGARPGPPESWKILQLDSWRLVAPFAPAQLTRTEYLLCARCGIRKRITGVRACSSSLSETQVH